MRIINLSIFVFGILLVFGCISVSTVQAQTTTPQTFDKNLRLGSVDLDVLRLQNFLNTNGFQIATSGPGSIGNETISFGRKTQFALSSFQDKYKEKILVPQGLTKPTGNFFKATRDMVNEIIKNSSSSRPVSLLNVSPITVVRPAHVPPVSTAVITYSVTAFNGTHQSISSDSVKTVQSGGSASFTVIPNTGYTNNTLVGGTCLTGSWDGNVYTTGTITSNCIVRFTATPNSYTVSVSPESGMTVSPSTDSTVTYGNKKKFNVVSTTGISSAGGTCPTGTWSNTVYTTGVITEDCNVSFSQDIPVGFSSGIGGTTLSASGILYMKQVGSSVYYSSDLSAWSELSWPVTIVNSDAGNSDLTVQFRGNIKLFAADQYFIAGSSNINFRGYNGVGNDSAVFILDNITGYPGLIQNGTNLATGYTDIQISEIYVNSLNSALTNGGGWIAQSYFTQGTIGYCGSNGSISINGGGIIGAYSQNAVITKCYTSGDIGTGAGGIVGAYADTPRVTYSYSTGSIGPTSGGIVGQLSSNANISSVYSTGSISVGAGGILGGYASGGSVSNAYSTGLIGSLAGGIVGIDSSSPTVLNSYTTGALSGGYGIISGSASDGSTNYSEGNNSSSGWSSSHAATALTGINTIWATVSANNPLKLRNTTRYAYSASSQTIAKGAASSLEIYGNYYECSILSIDGASPSTVPGITINSDMGTFSVSESTPSAVYSVEFSCSAALDTYSISDYTITVTD